VIAFKISGRPCRLDPRVEEGIALALSDGGFRFSPIFYIAPLVRARISLRSAPVAETFRVDLVVEFQNATINARSATAESGFD
jgi:hypothetical protein